MKLTGQLLLLAYYNLSGPIPDTADICNRTIVTEQILQAIAIMALPLALLLSWLNYI